MNYTTNYNLRLPEPTDNYTVEDANENARIVDEELKKRAALDETGKVPVEQIPELDYETSGSAAAVQKALEAHVGNKENPHGVTAEQVGAYEKEQVWDNSIASLLGLAAESLPLDGFKKLQQLLKQAQTDIENGVEIITGSYIGTGTYGKDNPNSLRFERKPMLVALLYLFYSNGTFQAIFSNSTNKIVSCMYLDSLSEDYKENAGFNASASYYSVYGKKSADGKTIYWYADEGDVGQFNYAETEYHYMAICI